jgi:hypothetical protein
VGGGNIKGDKRIYNGAAHVIRVIFAKDEFSCVLVNGISDV